MRIAIIICNNGLGHFKRCLLLVYHWLQKDPGIRFDIYCEKWQVDLSRTWVFCKPLMRNGAVSFLFGKLSGSIKWIPNGIGYSFTEYRSWLDTMKAEIPIQEADLVVSDNNVGILAIRSDCILCGSFLWPDLLDKYTGLSSEIKRIVEFESSVLKDCKPPMVCVEDMMMPAVRRLTKPVMMPWFCDPGFKTDNVTPQRNKRNLLLSPGGTSNLDQRFKAIAKVIASDGSFNLYLPPRLYKQLGLVNRGVYKFNFDDDSFNSCDLVICRPGMGILTDCVKYNIPMMAIGELDNSEMIHNAKRIEELGIGVNETGGNEEIILNRTFEMTREKTAQQFKSNISRLKTGGIQMTVKFLQSKLI